MSCAIIEPVDSFRVPTSVVQRVFESHSDIIKEAAQEFAIDQYMLGAVLIDEIAHLAPFEPIVEKVGADIIGKNTSVGVAQVKIETANDLIKKDIYNPSPSDKKASFLRKSHQCQSTSPISVCCSAGAQYPVCRGVYTTCH